MILRKDVSTPRYHVDLKCKCGAVVSKSLIYLKKHLEHDKEMKCMSCLPGSNKTHGMSYDRLFFIWQDMNRRCRDPKRKGFKNYGGRGISVCDEWKIFENFRDWSLSNGYETNLSIERVDVNSGYHPSNCCWIAKSDQSKNRRDSLIVEFRGNRMCLADFAKNVNACYETVRRRFKSGKTTEGIYMEFGCGS